MLDSRLIVFGNIGSTQQSENYELTPQNGKKTANGDALASNGELISAENAGNGTESTALSSRAASSGSSSVMLSSSDVLHYSSVDEALSLEDRVLEFLMSLFWVLESKRLDRSCEHVDNLTLLTAPFEHRKDSSITDLDGRLSEFFIERNCVWPWHHSWHCGLVVKTSVFDWQTFPDLWLTCDHFEG